MDKSNYITTKVEQKHLSHEHYDLIQSEYNHYMSAKHNKQSKTVFMKALAERVGTSLSNLYYLINDGTVMVLNSNLTSRTEFCSTAAVNQRKSKRVSNSSKLERSSIFIEMVCKSFFDEGNIGSIDEIVHDFKINRTTKILGIGTVCTKTMYNYIRALKIRIKPIDCPMIVSIKPRKRWKQAKRQKSVSIDH